MDAVLHRSVALWRSGEELAHDSVHVGVNVEAGAVGGGLVAPCSAVQLRSGPAGGRWLLQTAHRRARPVEETFELSRGGKNILTTCLVFWRSRQN